jgi:hypothetical protein
MLRIKFLIPCLVLLAAALASCMPFSLPSSLPGVASATPLPVTVSPPADTATPQPSPTPLLIPPTISSQELSLTPPPTKTKVPTKTKLPTRTSVPTKTKAPPKMMNDKIVLIAVNDNGAAGKKIGCGDSAVPVVVQVPYTKGVLAAALNKLLSIKDQYYGESGLYNALYQSNLTVDKVTVKSGVADIRLKGTLILGGVCDSPRVQAQLEETALQFSTVKKVKTYLNNIPLATVLSEK